jgi:hypothetical protein
MNQACASSYDHRRGEGAKKNFLFRLAQQLILRANSGAVDPDTNISKSPLACAYVPSMFYGCPLIRATNA